MHNEVWGCAEILPFFGKENLASIFLGGLIKVGISWGVFKTI